MAAIEEKLYPNCDATVWLRSCEEEVEEPLEGQMSGMYGLLAIVFAIVTLVFRMCSDRPFSTLFIAVLICVPTRLFEYLSI